MTDEVQEQAVVPITDRLEPPQHDLGVWHLIRADVGSWKKIWHCDASAPAPRRLFDSLKLIWNYSGLRATLLYRFSHAIWRKRIPALPGILGRMNLTLHGFDVPPSVPIGPGLYIPHPVGTVIMAKSIGANVSIISGVTIGMREKPLFPIINDNVFIGAGARILGDITIGSGANIGANAVVLNNVPTSATAVGVPARIIVKDIEQSAVVDCGAARFNQEIIGSN